MAELHKNQTAWSAPEQKPFQFSKRQDYLSSAATQLGEMADNIAKVQVAIEDNTIESAMKQEQEEALNWLQNQQERNPADYSKHIYTVSDRLRTRLSSFSKEAVARFNRNNPEYFDAVSLASNKIVLDKQTKQLTAAVKTDMPMIASESIAMAMQSKSEQGTAEAYEYGLGRIQSMVAGLPIEEQDALISEYKKQFGDGVLQAAFSEQDPEKLVSRVVDIMNNIKLTPDKTPQEREYYKQLANNRATSIVKARQSELDALNEKTASVLPGVIYSQLDGLLAAGNYAEYDRLATEYRMYGGIVESYDENGVPTKVHSVLGEGGITKEQLNGILVKVKEQEKHYNVMHQEKTNMEQALMLSTAGLAGALDTKNPANVVAAEVQLKNLVENPKVRRLMGDSDVYKEARKKVVERDAAALEALTPQIKGGAAIYKSDTLSGTPYLDPVQSASYKIAQDINLGLGSFDNQVLGRDGGMSYDIGLLSYDDLSSYGDDRYVTIQEARTLAAPMREWEKEQYKVAESDAEYHGSVLESLNMMTPLLIENPAMMASFGFPKHVTPDMVRLAAADVAKELIFSRAWNEDAVSDSAGERNTDLIKSVFDRVYKKAVGLDNVADKNKASREYLSQQMFFNTLASVSYGSAKDSGVIESILKESSSYDEIDLKGYTNRPFAEKLKQQK